MTADSQDFPSTEPSADVALPLAEPMTAVRSSPSAVASLVVALASLYFVPKVVFPFGTSGPGMILVLLGVALTLALAVVAFWLARKGEAEIAASASRLGGVGFTKAARVLAIIAVVATLLSLGTGFVEFGFGGERTVIENAPPPYVPAAPVEPPPRP